jgi:methyl-accepting chemotaxis protein
LWQGGQCDGAIEVAVANLRLLTDRRVGTKIMAAVGVVATFGMIDGGYALSSLAATNDQVKAVYGHNQELNAIGNLRAAVNRSWLGLDDYLLAGSDAARADAKTAIDEADTQAIGYATEYRSYPIHADARTSLDSFRTAWAAYDTLVTDRVLPIAGDAAAVTRIRGGELATVRQAVRADLSELAGLTVRAGAEQMTTAESRYQSTERWVLILVIGSTVLAVVLAVVAARLIVTPLSRCVQALERIGRGDLTARVTVQSSDEVGRMSAALNHTAEAVAGMVGRIQGSSTVLASASEELSTVSLQLSASAEETSAQVGTVSEAADRVSHNVQTVAAGADEMGVSIREIANNANEAAGVAGEAARTVQDTNAGVARLGDASSQIGTVVALITSIAEQTNLLALNATIEAARAGEAGKGFAVVASEVKDLAQETARATQQITAQVSAIQAESGNAVEAIQQIGTVITTISDYTTTIATAVEEQTATTAEISRSVGHAAEGTSSIAETIAGVAEAARQVTDGATETQQTAADLARTAAELQATVAEYQI